MIKGRTQGQSTTQNIGGSVVGGRPGLWKQAKSWAGLPGLGSNPRSSRYRGTKAWELLTHGGTIPFVNPGEMAQMFSKSKHELFGIENYGSKQVGLSRMSPEQKQQAMQSMRKDYAKWLASVARSQNKGVKPPKRQGVIMGNQNWKKLAKFEPTYKDSGSSRDTTQETIKGYRSHDIAPTKQAISYQKQNVGGLFKGNVSGRGKVTRGITPRNRL